MTSPRASFWAGKRVLLTGHSGFKGSWMSIWLHKLGAEVFGISLPPETEPNLLTLARIEEICESHFCDIRDADKLAALIRASSPEIVFHFAAQALVRASYRDPLSTYATNVMGTAHVLEALRDMCDVKVAVMVTTDKVYRNFERPRPFQEEDLLGGHDPYSASKAASEMVIASYRAAYLAEQGVAVAAARAGNVIGGGDWSDERLIPDAVRAWQAGEELEIRRPQAIRPWQHVLDPLAAYLMLADQLWEDQSKVGAYNFGPETDSAASVKEIVEMARPYFKSPRVRYASEKPGFAEAGLLTLSTKKAESMLGFKPRWPLVAAVNLTMEWYRAQHSGADARTLCLENIEAFTD